MKSKKTTYLLLASVVAIWGVILWKIFFREQDETGYVVAEQKKTIESPLCDTLMLNYRDPFLGTFAVKPSPKPKEGIQGTVQKTINAPVPTVHNLRYLGQITKEGLPHGLIEINGSLHTIRRGETTEGYRLETLWTDSVKLRWKNEHCTIKLNH